MNAFRTHPRRIPYCNPYIIHKHKIPLSRRENEATHNRSKRSIGCPRTGTSENSRKKEGHIHTLQERTKGLAGHPELENELPFKNGTETRRTFRNRRSTWTGHLSVKTPIHLANSQCFSCSTIETVSRNRSLWRELSPT